MLQHGAVLDKCDVIAKGLSEIAFEPARRADDADPEWIAAIGLVKGDDAHGIVLRGRIFVAPLPALINKKPCKPLIEGLVHALGRCTVSCNLEAGADAHHRDADRYHDHFLRSHYRLAHIAAAISIAVWVKSKIFAPIGPWAS